MWVNRPIECRNRTSAAPAPFPDTGELIYVPCQYRVNGQTIEWLRELHSNVYNYCKRATSATVRLTPSNFHLMEFDGRFKADGEQKSLADIGVTIVVATLSDPRSSLGSTFSGNVITVQLADTQTMAKHIIHQLGHMFGLIHPFKVCDGTPGQMFPASYALVDNDSSQSGNYPVSSRVGCTKVTLLTSEKTLMDYSVLASQGEVPAFSAAESSLMRGGLLNKWPTVTTKDLGELGESSDGPNVLAIVLGVLGAFVFVVFVIFGLRTYRKNKNIDAAVDQLSADVNALLVQVAEEGAQQVERKKPSGRLAKIGHMRETVGAVKTRITAVTTALKDKLETANVESAEKLSEAAVKLKRTEDEAKASHAKLKDEYRVVLLTNIRAGLDAEAQGNTAHAEELARVRAEHKVELDKLNVKLGRTTNIRNRNAAIVRDHVQLAAEEKANLETEVDVLTAKHEAQILKLTVARTQHEMVLKEKHKKAITDIRTDHEEKLKADKTGYQERFDAEVARLASTLQESLLANQNLEQKIKTHEDTIRKFGNITEANSQLKLDLKELQLKHRQTSTELSKLQKAVHDAQEKRPRFFKRVVTGLVLALGTAALVLNPGAVQGDSNALVAGSGGNAVAARSASWDPSGNATVIQGRRGGSWDGGDQFLNFGTAGTPLAYNATDEDAQVDDMKMEGFTHAQQDGEKGFHARGMQFNLDDRIERSHRITVEHLRRINAKPARVRAASLDESPELPGVQARRRGENIGRSITGRLPTWLTGTRNAFNSNS